MRAGLRKISQLTLCARIVLFREQSKIVAPIEQPFYQFACFFLSAEQMPAIRQPKGAGKKYSFVARQSIDARFLWPIAQHKTILHQFAFNCLNRPANTFVSDRQKTGERHCKEARIQSIRPINLRESFLLRVKAALANFGANLITNFLPATEMLISGATAVLDQLDRAIECQPRHHFGMGKLLAAAADFPDSFVRLLPMRLQELHYRDHERPVRLGHFNSGTMALPCRG